MGRPGEDSGAVGGDRLWAGGGVARGRGPSWEWSLTTTALWGGDGAAQEEGLAPKRVCLSFPCSPGRPRGTAPLTGCGQVGCQDSPAGSFRPRPLSFWSSRGGPRAPGWEHLLLHSWGHQLHSPSLGRGGQCEGASQVPGMAELGATREESSPPQAPCTPLPPPGPGPQGEGTGGAAFAHLPRHVVSSFGSDAVPAGLAAGKAGAVCGWGPEQLVMGAPEGSRLLSQVLEVRHALPKSPSLPGGFYTR